MRAILELAVRGRIPMILIAGGLAGGSLLPHLRLLALLSGALIGLATLRYGLYEGLFVLVGTGVVLIAASTFFIDNSMASHLEPLAWAIMVVLLLSWVWTWAMAGALRRANAQGFALLIGAGLSVLSIIVFPIFVLDTNNWWTEVIVKMAEAVRAQNPQADPFLFEQLVAVFTVRASIMTGVAASAAMFFGILMLLLARWWHAVLDNPGGFSREFGQLRLDRRLGLLVLGLLLVSIFAGEAVAIFGAEVVSIAFVLFIFQGLAMVHALVAQTGMWAGWLWIMYVMVALAPQMLLILAAVGFLDSWFDFRKRVGARNT